MTCTIGKISNVKIVNVTHDSVAFTTDSKLAVATDASDASDKRIAGLYRCPKADVWQTEGGMLDGIDVEPTVTVAQGAEGAVGPLYLESRSLLAPGTSSRGPCHIRGFRTPLLFRDEVAIPLKWPECGGIDDRDLLPLVPSAITVSGYTQDPGMPSTQVSLNLYDLELALPEQDIEWNGAGDITLGLTPAGFQEFNLPRTDDLKIKIWPTRIVVTGQPPDDVGHGSAIDVRNHYFAWPVQRLTWQEPPPRVAVRATSAGFAKFGILPETLRSAVNLVLKASETTDGLLPAIEHIWRARRSTADWEFYAVDAFDHASDYRRMRHLQERWEFGRSARGPGRGR
jgi:hypothetical protein